MSIFEKRIQMLEKLNSYGIFGRLDFEDFFLVSQAQAVVIINEFLKLGFIEKDDNCYRVTEKTKRIFK